MMQIVSVLKRIRNIKMINIKQQLTSQILQMTFSSSKGTSGESYSILQNQSILIPDMKKINERLYCLVPDRLTMDIFVSSSCPERLSTLADCKSVGFRIKLMTFLNNSPPFLCRFEECWFKKHVDTFLSKMPYIYVMFIIKSYQR